MRPHPRSRRFDPRRLVPPIGTDWAALFDELDAAPPWGAEESPDKAVARDADEALEQITLDGCSV
jgi:hypothetical protein